MLNSLNCAIVRNWLKRGAIRSSLHPLITWIYNPLSLYGLCFKGNTGQQYQQGISIQEVLDRLLHEFDVLEKEGNQCIQKMIDKTSSIALKVFRTQRMEKFWLKMMKNMTVMMRMTM